METSSTTSARTSKAITPSLIAPLVNKPKIARARISKSLAEPLPERTSSPTRTPKITVQFKLTVAQAEAVSVAGTFNGWDARRTPLKKEPEGWVATIRLPRGVYEYRFVVDGQWANDPGATQLTPNPFGTKNAVLTV